MKFWAPLTLSLLCTGAWADEAKVVPPEHTEKIGPQKFRFEQYSLVEIRAAIAAAIDKAQQVEDADAE